MNQNRIILLVTLLVAGLASCKKDKDDTQAPKITPGVLVLCEGLANKNNSMLSYYSFSTQTASTDLFANTNAGTGLGDTGNDMVIYGGKMYIVMNVSSVVTVVDAHTGLKIKNIDFLKSDGAPRQPRYVIPYKSKILVSDWDGKVAVIDTTGLTIEQDINLGKTNLEQMAIIGDKLYVVNSGALNTVNDSTVSEINLNTMTETRKITVGYNPGYMTADEAGNLYITCGPDYNTGTLGARLVKVSTASNSVLKVADTSVGRIKYYNGALYAASSYEGVKTVRKLSTTDFSQQSPNFVTDGTVIVNPYNVNVNPDNDDVYITDAKDYKTSGEVFCFDKNGKIKFSFSTTPAVNPSTVVFVK
ncbi:hypothetical protein A4H97_31295 [Niastella yeongjuensis]|uniref:SMP-30/Gluconolactonase/LRE-like region domain-containing protein n=1 Tax=Niastella yeongjuensis TaxID=354355 RepID=A0A1V9EJE2_9BACT|nr:DUF5074 domain-containing protein [Niastella yeongjuensis]OQP46249.1 hypothetical protein A4H97_31295 [Niastella yeongjuensis]SEP46169.1 hypothetical protein SAMN05660816_06416 [Niastella yeongjuensis]